MKIIVRTPVSQRRLIIDNFDDLNNKIKQSFKIESYQLFSDPERQVPLSPSSLEDNKIIYMSYEMETPKIYKEDNKCSHSPEAVCPKCATLDPLDKNRSSGLKVKYLSYRSYKEMLKDSNKNEDKFDYSLKVCDEHPRNVKCMKCMEKVITLLPQVYRQVDYVEFDNSECLEAFIKKWRTSGRQRIGFLIGRYKDYEEYPMGVKAVASGIWEVEQENFPDGAVLKKIPERFIVDDLEILGLIYTDLFMNDGEMFNYKKERDFIISNVELNFFYQVQRVVNNPRMVNICIGVNETKDITPECFMVTEQFRALMDASALSMTTDAPYFETKREISYMIRNEYQKDVPIKANPFVPVDYFVVKCEVGHKNDPLFKNFAVIEKCNLRKLAGHFYGEFTLEKFSNFNILVYLSAHLSTEKIFKAVLNDDVELFEKFMTENSKFFKDLDGMCERKWNCTECTFENEFYAELCEMCGTPKIIEN